MQRYFYILWVLAFVLISTVSPLTAQDDHILIPNDAPIIIHYDATTTEVEYHFDGRTGDIIKLNLEKEDQTGTFRFMMRLIAPDGVELFSGDTFNRMFSYRDSRSYQLPQDGLYTYIVTAMPSATDGDYSLSLEKREPPLLASGQAVTDYFSTNFYDMPYRIQGAAGDNVIVSTFSGDIDTVMRLIAPSGEEIAFDDDSGGDLNAQIGPLELPEDGVYEIHVSEYERSPYGGAFSITYTPLPSDYWDYGERETFTLMENPIEIPFYGREGEIVAITLDGDGEATIPAAVRSPVLMDPIAGNATEETPPYPLERFPIPLTGDYVLTLTPDPSEQAGEVTVTLEKIGEGYFNLDGLAFLHLTPKRQTGTVYADGVMDAEQVLVFRTNSWSWSPDVPAFSMATVHIREGDRDTITHSFTLDAEDLAQMPIHLVLPPATSEEIAIDVEADVTGSVFFTLELRPSTE